MQCLKAQQGISVLDGLVVVLAPAILENSDDFTDSLLALMTQSSLAKVRWMVLELGDTVAKRLSRAKPGAVMLARCEVDPGIYRREHLAAMAAAASAPQGASSMQLAGGAGPKGVLAPDDREAAQRAALAPELLERELGPLAVLTGPSGITIRQDILNAALAMQEADPARAVALQAKAVLACAAIPRLASTLHLTLGTYQLEAGDAAAARHTFQEVAALSEGAGSSTSPASRSWPGALRWRPACRVPTSAKPSLTTRGRRARAVDTRAPPGSGELPHGGPTRRAHRR